MQPGPLLRSRAASALTQGVTREGRRCRFGVCGGGSDERQLPQEDAGALWQPYVDPPLLTPRMVLGLDEVSTVERQRLLRYLAALVATRRAPVHVNVAFNAAYFGFDLETRSYVGGALNDLFSFPEVHVQEGGDALPVGALVNIATGVHPLFAEVVYKEGAHPLLGDDGSLPDWLSGAPAAATGPGQADAAPDSALGGPVLHERLIVDVDAFGTDMSLTRQQLQRIRSRGRALDADGHVLLDARYSSRADADLDEVSFYARYLLTRGREQVLSASAPLPLGTLLTEEADDEQYEAALLGLLHTVAQALGSLPELRMWRGYAFTRAGLGARLRDQGALGGPDLETVAVQLGRGVVPSRPSRWGPTRKVTYTAIGPRLRDVRGSAEGLKGLGYALAVCHANAVVNDYVSSESDEVTGLLHDQVSLRLDDPWQGGGVWRAEHPGSTYARVDVTQPLGLGWRSSLPAQTPSVGGGPTPEPEQTLLMPEPEPELVEDDESEDDAALLSVTDSQVSWTQPLRLSHQLDGLLPLPQPVVGKMRMSGGAPMLRLLLTHDGYELSRSQAQQNTDTELFGPRPQLGGIDWPLEFFPGIILTCMWPLGGGVVRATSTRLDAPVTVDGMEIEHRYDPSILTRDTAPGEARRNAVTAVGGSTGPAGTLTLPQRVLRAVRRLGRLDRDGRAVLARSSLTAAVYGVGAGADSHAADADLALDEVVARLVRDGDLTLDVASVDASRGLQYPAVPGLQPVDMIVYTPQIVVGPPTRHGCQRSTRWTRGSCGSRRSAAIYDPSVTLAGRPALRHRQPTGMTSGASAWPARRSCLRATPTSHHSPAALSHSTAVRNGGHLDRADRRCRHSLSHWRHAVSEASRRTH